MNRKDIMDWIHDYIAAQLKVDRQRVEADIQFEDYGLDSRASMEMIGKLSELIGRDLDPGIVYDYSTIETLTARVVELLQEPVSC